MTDWLLWNTKEGILKNIGNQIYLVPIEIYYMDKKYNASQLESKLFGSQHSSEYLILCSA